MTMDTAMFNGTIETARVVRVLLTAMELRLQHESQRTEVAGVHYVKAEPMAEDLSVVLGVPLALVQQAVKEAVQQGVFEVPASHPVSEHPVTFIRPATL